MKPSSRDVLARLDPRIPTALIARLRAGGDPVPPEDAATVILLRDRPGGLETYVLHRHSRMPFAAGMVVFPGGRVDPVDLAGAGSKQQTLRRCAVRETAEETGVSLDPQRLHDWAHWVTPEFEPRRYDTFFYLAAMPDDQQADDISGEATKAEWRRPAELLRDADHGVLALMPPTRSVLIELSEHSMVDSVIAAAAGRKVETVLPQPVEQADGWIFDYGLDKGSV